MAMRRGLLAVFVGTLAFAGAASAADLAPSYKAPPGPPPPPFSWTGLYFGGTVGAAWTNADVSLSAVNGAAPLFRVTDIPGLNALGSPSLSQTNAIFGLKAGYNQQWGAFVLGLEGDVSSFHFSPTAVSVGTPFIGFGGLARFSTNVQTSWLATIRGRAGFARDNWLFYGTGGVAFADVKFSNTYMALSPLGAGLEFEAATASQTQVGWAAGAGVDYALYPHVILSAEYLHVDLGTITASGPIANNGLSATFNFSTKVTSDLVRFGAAYKF